MERTLAAMVGATGSPRLAHVVCTLRDRGALADELPADVAVIPLNCRRARRLAAIRLASVVRRVRPDVVHARNVNTWCDTALACRIAGQEIDRTVLGFHGLERAGGFTSGHRRRVRWLRLRRFRFAVVSRAGRQQLIDELGVPAHRVQVLPNGVDVERYRPATVDQRLLARATLGVRPDAMVIAMVGALVPVKDHHTALAAFGRIARRHANLCVLVAGDGPLRGVLEDRAAELPESVRVRFLGVVGDVRRVLHAADVFVHPSRCEQSSNAVLEAMACGLPILVTSVGDAVRVTDAGRCARLVRPGDPGVLAAELAEVVRDANERRRLGAAARRRAEQDHGFSATVEQYRAFYLSFGRSTRQPELNPCVGLPASCRIAR